MRTHKDKWDDAYTLRLSHRSLDANWTGGSTGAWPPMPSLPRPHPWVSSEMALLSRTVCQYPPLSGFYPALMCLISTCIAARLKQCWLMKMTSKTRIVGTLIPRAARSFARSSHNGSGTRRAGTGAAVLFFRSAHHRICRRYEGLASTYRRACMCGKTNATGEVWSSPMGASFF